MMRNIRFIVLSGKAMAFCAVAFFCTLPAQAESLGEIVRAANTNQEGKASGHVTGP